VTAGGEALGRAEPALNLTQREQATIKAEVRRVE